MMEGTLSEYAFYLLCPCALLVGFLCLVKHIIRRTEFFHSDDSLEGKTILVTGESNGRGRIQMCYLLLPAASMILNLRTRNQSNLRGVFRRSHRGWFTARVVAFGSVRREPRCASLHELDIRHPIFAAAILTGRDFTADGIDLMMGVNFVGHFFLTTLLIDKLRSTPGGIARVINVICGGFKQGLLSDLEDMEDKRVRNEYDLKHVYRSSKLGLFLFNRELARKYRPFDVAAFCVDPGLVASSLYKHLPGFQGRFMSTLARVMFRSTEEAMQSVLYAIMARKIESDSGKARNDCRAFDVKNSEWTEEVTRGLWERTEELIRSKGVPFSLSHEAEEEDLGGGFAAAKVNLEVFAKKMQAGGGKQDVHEASAEDEEEEEEDEE
ncbi:unnamed protein product [Ixodes hexagonus]